MTTPSEAIEKNIFLIKQDTWKNPVKVSRKVRNTMDPQILDGQNFGLWLIRKLQLHNHTFLDQHPNPSFVLAFHILSERQTALEKACSITINFPQEIPSQKSPTQRLGWGGRGRNIIKERGFHKDKKSNKNQETKRKWKRTNITCVLVHRASSKKVLWKSFLLISLSTVRSGSNTQLQRTEKRLAQDHSSGSKQGKSLETWQKEELAQRTVELVPEVQISLIKATKKKERTRSTTIKNKSVNTGCWKKS